MKKIAIIVDSSSGIRNGEFDNVFVLPLIINATNKQTKLIMIKLTLMKLKQLNCLIIQTLIYRLLKHQWVKLLCRLKKSMMIMTKSM